MKKKLQVVDLFAGAGGLLLGFEQAGFETISANENDPMAVQMLTTNYPWVNVNSNSIENIVGNDLLINRKRNEVDVLVGGPPCQGFSLIGLRNSNDPRNKLVAHYLRILNELRPKTFLFENVPGMLSTLKGNFIKVLLQEFDSLGYEVVLPIRILHADQFGVPQHRSRLFIIGKRKDLNINLEYPEPTHISPRDNKDLKNQDLFATKLQICPTIRDAISDLPNIDLQEHLIKSDFTFYDKEPISEYSQIMRGIINDPLDLSKKPANWNPMIVTGCKRTVHGPVLTQRCLETAPGDSLPVSRLYKLMWDNVANTIRAGTPTERGSYSSPRPIHPEQPRVISVREGARIQSFPDWINFHTTKWHGFRQIGNSVCPLMARALAYKLKEALN